MGIWILFNFDYDNAGVMQFAVDKEWIDVIDSRYILGLDGISLPLLILSMAIVVLPPSAGSRRQEADMNTPRRCRCQWSCEGVPLVSG